MKRIIAMAACLAAVSSTTLRAAEPVDMQKRAAELKSLKLGHVRLLVVQHVLRQGMDARREGHRRFPRHRLRHRPMGPHRQGSGHGLHPLPHQAPRRLLPVGHQDHRPQGDPAPLGRDVLAELRKSLRQVRHQAGTVLLAGRVRRQQGLSSRAATRRKCRRPSSRNSAPQYGPIEFFWMDCAAGQRRAGPQGNHGLGQAVSARLFRGLQRRRGGRSAGRRDGRGRARSRISCRRVHLPDPAAASKAGRCGSIRCPNTTASADPAEDLQGLPRRGEVRQHLLAGRRPRLRRQAAEDRRRNAAGRSAR